MNLFQKIVEVRKIAKGFKKDGKGYNYTYVTGDQVLSKIRDKMNELNLLLIPSTKLGEHHVHNYKTAKGKEVTDFIVSGEMSYTWIDGDNPEDYMKVDWAYYGQMDEISRAYGSALTYSERYFLLKCLGLPTDEDDPDAKAQEQSSNQATGKKDSKPQQYNKNKKDGDKKNLKCSDCNADITAAVDTFSTKRYGKSLCRDCQKKQ